MSPARRDGVSLAQAREHYGDSALYVSGREASSYSVTSFVAWAEVTSQGLLSRVAKKQAIYGTSQIKETYLASETRSTVKCKGLPGAGLRYFQ